MQTLFHGCLQYDENIKYICIPDLEGNKQKLLFILEYFNLISSNYDLSSIKLELNQHVVFMGDIFDKGINNKMIAEFILYLKNTYPNQVTFLLGNRDVNKIRYIIEIPKILDFILNQITYDELIEWFNYRIKWTNYDKIETDDNEIRIKHFIDWWETNTCGAKNKIFYWWKEQNTISTVNSTQNMSLEDIKDGLLYMYDAINPNGNNPIIYKILQYGEVCKVLPTHNNKYIFVAHASPFCDITNFNNIYTLKIFCNQQTSNFRQKLKNFIENISSLDYYYLVSMTLDQIDRKNYNEYTNDNNNFICYNWNYDIINGIIDINNNNHIKLLDILSNKCNISSIILGHKPFPTGKIIKYKKNNQLNIYFTDTSFSDSIICMSYNNQKINFTGLLPISLLKEYKNFFVNTNDYIKFEQGEYSGEIISIQNNKYNVIGKIQNTCNVYIIHRNFNTYKSDIQLIMYNI